MGREILMGLIGVSVLVLSIGFYQNNESAQKIENIEKLYRIKKDQELERDFLQTKKNIREIEVMMDSINKL